MTDPLFSHTTTRRPLLCALIALLAMVSVFRPVAAQSSGSYTDLHDFGGKITSNGATIFDGWSPQSGVTIDSSGNRYGTTQEGGANEWGVVWEITTAGVYEDLHDFGGTVIRSDGSSGMDGVSPNAGVTFDSAGDMFGTASGSGGHNGGIVWEITAGGAYKDLHDFGGTVTNANGTTGPDGTGPECSVIFDVAGNMYGTTTFNGPNNGTSAGDFGGIIWEITAGGAYKDLHDFGGTIVNADGAAGPDGIEPVGTLASDNAGDLFGTASLGGPNLLYTEHGSGLIWEITAAGNYKDIHDFDGMITNADGDAGADGSTPEAGVAFDANGNMYGTTFGGGANEFNPSQGSFGLGMVWEITAGGVYKDLHDFGGTITNANGSSGSDGTSPVAPVAFDGSGELLGTAENGGPGGEGMIWKITAGGVYQDLHDFGGTITNANGSSGSDGASPGSGVTFDPSGDMFGTTSEGGANNQGLVWEIVPTVPVATFSAGLQMFSLPYSYTGVSLDTIFGYSGVTLAVWMPATSTYALSPTSPADQINLGQGYWARFPQEVVISQAGTPAPTNQNFDIPLSAGWNMIGQPFLSSTPVSSLLFNNGTETFAQSTTGNNPLIGNTIWAYPSGSTGYVQAATLNPNQGYWIFAFSNTDVSVPHP